MNWLTEQLAHRPDDFAFLAEIAQTEDGSTLRRVRYPGLLEALGDVTVVGQEGDPALAEAFALLEDADAARTRRERAASTDEPLPSSFTLAVQDSNGSVLYLPDEAEERTSLQLFAAFDDQLMRVRADGSFDGMHAALERVVTIKSVGPCPDGPCVWGASCGNGCVCTKYEMTATAGRVYGLACR